MPLKTATWCTQIGTKFVPSTVECINFYVNKDDTSGENLEKKYVHSHSI